MSHPVLACAGNAFAVVAGSALPADPRSFARAACAAGVEHRALDGVIAMLAPQDGGDCRMAVYNADGSRPEACGDGLLCVAVHVAGERDGPVTVETDSGTRVVMVEPDSGDGRPARGTLGLARVVEADVELDVGERTVVATLVDVGNPHCVLFVDELTDELVYGLGPALERHEHFPCGANVEFAHLEGGAIRARVWERGVGETPACGTGACALATAAAESGRVELPVRVDYPGGVLTVGRTPDGEVWLKGVVRQIESIET